MSAEMDKWERDQQRKHTEAKRVRRMFRRLGRELTQSSPNVQSEPRGSKTLEHMKTSTNKDGATNRVGSTGGSAVERKMQIIRLREKQLADWKAHADRMEDALTRIHTILGQHYGIDANGVEVECYEIANAALSPNTQISLRVDDKKTSSPAP